MSLSKIQRFVTPKPVDYSNPYQKALETMQLVYNFPWDGMKTLIIKWDRKADYY